MRKSGHNGEGFLAKLLQLAPALNGKIRWLPDVNSDGFGGLLLNETGRTCLRGEEFLVVLREAKYSEEK